MKKFALTIPKPCHENWDGMTPEDKGRFCGACQKTVIDFRSMSDRELAQFFKKPLTNACGHFHADPLIYGQFRKCWAMKVLLQQRSIPI